MKKPVLIALAVSLMAFPAYVCAARGAGSGEREPVDQQILYSVDDRTDDDSQRNGAMSFQKFSFEICGDPTRIKDMAFYDIEERPSKKIGCTILYQFDW